MLDEGSNAEVLHTDTACSSPGGGAAAESSGRSSAGLLLLVKSDSRLARGRRLAQPDVLPSGSWVLGGHLLICWRTDAKDRQLSNVHRFRMRKPSQVYCPVQGKDQEGFLLAHSVYQVRVSANEDTLEELQPWAGLCGDAAAWKGTA